MKRYTAVRNDAVGLGKFFSIIFQQIHRFETDGTAGVMADQWDNPCVFFRDRDSVLAHMECNPCKSFKHTFWIFLGGHIVSKRIIAERAVSIFRFNP